MDSLYQLNDGLRIVGRAIKKHFVKTKKYSGSVNDVSRKILDSCYNNKKNYFMVSSGHFKQFYSRDFGMICESLISLGYENEVRSTLIYAMDIFVKAKRITTHMTPSGTPFNFPNHTPESAAYMLHSLITLNDKKLLMKYSKFFEIIAEEIYEKDIEKDSGLLRKDKHFSSMKDHSLRVSDCYLNCMLGMFAIDLKKAGINSKLSKYNYKLLIKNNFWKEDHFIEDLSGRNITSGDANVFPFWTGLFSEKDMLNKAILSIQKKGLDRPWPLKYTAKEDVPKKLHLADLFAYGYEHDTVWMHLGICYLKVIEKHNKALLKKYLKQYEDLIKKHSNFLEVYFPEGKPFIRLFYYTDESMSWVAVFLELYEKYF